MSARQPIAACINFYQKYLRSLLPCACRFVPTCSEYTKQAIVKYGACKGVILAGRRILNCHPFASRCGFDPLV
ncbi:MAG: membrane protein insertion efficiency factor YidD [Candidatus Omnitrophota bacterium]